MSAPPQPRSRVHSFLNSSPSFSSLANAASLLGALSTGLSGNRAAGLELVLREQEAEEEGDDSEDQVETSQMHLSTHCKECGESVHVEVPAWMIRAIGQPAPSNHAVRDVEEESRTEWRNGVVSTAVSVAIAVKESPLPGLIVGAIKWIFVVSLYLDSRFSLHQRFAIFLGTLLEAFISVEREVGLFRGMGETISVLWEASIKSSIAFAKASTASSYANAAYADEGPQPTYAKRTAHTRTHSHRDNASSRSTPPGQFTAPTASSTAHARSHANASSPQKLRGKSSLYDGNKPFLVPNSIPTLRRTSRSTSSLKSSVKGLSVPFPSRPTPSSNSSGPPSYSAYISPPSSSAPSSPQEPRRRRSRSATGGSVEKEKEKEQEIEREKELARLRERTTSYNSWTGRAIAVGKSLSGRA